jgi:uncharacterized protein DUF397
MDKLDGEDVARMSVAREDAGLRWHKSSRSAGNGNCVEVAELSGTVAVRDSKNPQGPVLHFDADTWSRFVDAIRSGALDGPGSA